MHILERIRDEPWQRRDVVLSQQLERIRALLAHAERTVPYYRETFRELGVRSHDVRTHDDFARLPVLTKDIVRERARDLISTVYPVSRLQPHHSGGSTGQPLSFYHDRDYVAASDAGTFRTMLQAGWRPGEMVAFFWGWNKRLYAMSRLEFEARQHLRREYQFDSFRGGEAEFARWVRTFDRIRPKVVYGYASAIAQFAAYVLATGRRLPPIRGVFTTAEKLLPLQREQMEAAFGCQVFDCYGSSEVRNIAAQCRHRRMHVNADFVVLETLDGGVVEGAAAAASASRPFVLTSLRSYGMPFIRYRNDDCGALVDGDCACGSGFPLMQLDIARTSDHFVLSDGRLVHGLFFIHRLYGSRGVANFQFHQVARNHIILYAVRAKSDGGFDESVARAVQEILSLTTVPITVDLREVEHIPLSAAGKHRYVRSDVAHR